MAWRSNGGSHSYRPQLKMAPMPPRAAFLEQTAHFSGHGGLQRRCSLACPPSFAFAQMSRFSALLNERKSGASSTRHIGERLSEVLGSRHSEKRLNWFWRCNNLCSKPYISPKPRKTKVIVLNRIFLFSLFLFHFFFVSSHFLSFLNRPSQLVT